jgi:hypothetical protein
MSGEFSEAQCVLKRLSSESSPCFFSLLLLFTQGFFLGFNFLFVPLHSWFLWLLLSLCSFELTSMMASGLVRKTYYIGYFKAASSSTHCWEAMKSVGMWQ